MLRYEGKLKRSFDRWLRDRLLELTPYYMRRLPFDQAFNAAYRRVGRELGLSRIEIVRGLVWFTEARLKLARRK